MTDTDNSDRLAWAVRTSCEVASEQGLSFDRAVVLSSRSNLLVHLHPTSVVARVAATTGTVRVGEAWLAREIAVAQHMAAKLAPVIPPSNLVAPGPHQHNGLVLSFWEFVEELEPPVDPHIAGRALRLCHEAIADFDGDLPVLEGLSESERILTQLISQGVFSPSDADMLKIVSDRIKSGFDRINLPMQPLHGDSNFSNVLNTTRGVLWADWEDTFVGHVGWDLACIVAPSRVFGTDIERSQMALDGYGVIIDEDLLDLFIEARTFQTLLWNAIAADNVERLEKRLEWVRDRLFSREAGAGLV